MFADRRDAGARLAEALRQRLVGTDAIILGVPRGGVVVAAEVARLLRLPMDVVIASKLGAPGQPEYAIGAVDADGDVSVTAPFQLPDTYVENEAAARSAEVRRRVDVYRRGRPAPLLEGRTVVVVDDGIATGLTIRKVVEYLRRHGAGHVVVATPVAPRTTAQVMRSEGLDLVTVDEPYDFAAVGQFYRTFGQTSDSEVLTLLNGATGEESSPR